jgi:hypothetical protein
MFKWADDIAGNTSAPSRSKLKRMWSVPGRISQHAQTVGAMVRVASRLGLHVGDVVERAR